MRKPINRFYLDFDGVINALRPLPEHGPILEFEDATIPALQAAWLGRKVQEPGVEIVWATHRETDVHNYMQALNNPETWGEHWQEAQQFRFPTDLPHLTFTDPTGSKLKDILAHYQASPVNRALVMEDSLASWEVEALVEAGLEVLLFDNALPITRRVGSLWAGSHSPSPAGLDSWTGVGFPGQPGDINSTRQAPESTSPAG